MLFTIWDLNNKYNRNKILFFSLQSTLNFSSIYYISFQLNLCLSICNSLSIVKSTYIWANTEQYTPNGCLKDISYVETCYGIEKDSALTITFGYFVLYRHAIVQRKWTSVLELEEIGIFPFLMAEILLIEFCGLNFLITLT